MSQDLAPFATVVAASRGRRFPEEVSRTRTAFARDRDRIIHTSAFRRLKEKTQVFVAHEGDQFRTRLTHSLEVSQIARSLAAAMKLDVDLAETIALAHDLGHPPFGHAGEDELEIQMQAYGGFDHNVQTFRVVTDLERRYPQFHGLNLTWETLEGIVKHNGPVTTKLGQPSWKPIKTYDADYSLELGGWAGAEAQVAALADDIAYNNHDVDDGVEAGIFALDDLNDVALIGPILAEVRAEWPGLDARLTRLEAVRRMIGAMVEDVIAETGRNVERHNIRSPDDVRALGQGLVTFSPQMARDLGNLRLFLTERMYRHWRVNRTRSQARRILADMFKLFMEQPDVLPPEWYARVTEGGDQAQARGVCDYIAGMTDRFAIEEHRRLFQLSPWG